MDEDDSGMPASGFEGESPATVLGRALVGLCTKQQPYVWTEGGVEALYMRLHDAEQVPPAWMGALRREGLVVVEKEIRRVLGRDE